jgi:hypothetical protein
MNREIGRGHRADIQRLLKINKLFMCPYGGKKRKNKLLRIHIEGDILMDLKNKQQPTHQKKNPLILK